MRTIGTSTYTPLGTIGTRGTSFGIGRRTAATHTKLNGWVPKSDKWVGRDGSTPKSGALRSRPGDNTKNFVAQWQSEGGKYVGYDNLVRLDGLLTSYSAGRSKAAKMDLLSELTLTYFAR